MICSECSSEISDNMANCPTCHLFIGYPNVRAVERKEEIDALEARYQKALNTAKAMGCEKAIQTFEKAMQGTFAVINVNIDFLQKFIKQDNELYSSYGLQIKGQSRKPDSENRKTKNETEKRNQTEKENRNRNENRNTDFRKPMIEKKKIL